MPKEKQAGGKRKSAAKTSGKTLNFEQSLEKLEAIVETLENGELSLEQALKSFEEGISLTRACQAELAEAEQSIKVLTKKNGKTIATEPETDSLDD